MSAGNPIYGVAAGPVGNGGSVNGYSVPVGSFETMTDVVVPNFHRRRNAGELFFNAMQKSRFEVSSSSNGGQITQRSPSYAIGQTYTWNGDLLSYLIAGLQTSTETYYLQPVLKADLPTERLVAEASTKARTVPSDSAILVTMAEYKETIRLLPSIVSGWTSYLKRINALGTRKSPLTLRTLQSASSAELKLLTDFWLATRFGIRPLITETLGVMQALNRTYDSLEKVRRTSRGSATFTTSEVTSYSVSHDIVVYPITRSDSVEQHVRAMGLFDGYMTLRDQLGFSARHIPVAAVDLIPFSFVLNWVVNINDFVYALSTEADPGYTYAGGCVVVETISTSTWQFSGGATCTQPYTYDVTRDGVGVTVAVRSHKERIGSLPPPKLVVRGSPFQSLTDLRLVDLTALLSQQLRGRNVGILKGSSR